MEWYLATMCWQSMADKPSALFTIVIKKKATTQQVTPGDSDNTTTY